MAKKILIIEDEEVLLDLLAKQIKASGFEVATAKDGEEGLMNIESFNPDLVLLDIVLPKLSGYEVLEKLNEKNIKIPVIIISNSGQPVDIGKATALGAKDYIVKAELNPDEIIEKIDKCLGLENGGAKTDGSSSRHAKRGDFVLLAEDDVFLRELCSKKLLKKGYTVETATDGGMAYEKIMNLKPDIVLLDVIMPGMEGFEILKKVKASKDKKIANIPIIILSNLGQESDVQKGLEMGAKDYLIKTNYTMEEIIEKIEKYLHSGDDPKHK